MNNKLIIKKVNSSYRNKEVLKDVSFTCENGVTALLGNNGAGKTTLMNIISGLKRVNSGEIYLNNEDIFNNENIKYKIGYLPQNFDIYKNITGYDLLSYVCDLKGVEKGYKKNHISDLVDKFDLGKVIKKNIGKYSGGYKRRLGIVQAVIGNPSLVIIDEPTVGLDPEQRLEFRRYLSSIGNDKIVLISTHIIEDVELAGKKVIILKNGEVCYEGDVDSVINETIGNVYGVEVNINDYDSVKKNIKIIEEERINNDLIKIKFINSQNINVTNSYVEKEVSLENAYIYFQERY